MKEVTRIAPSPTGDMHLGTARTAYFNYLAAKTTGGQFILRIDDTDQNRNDEKHVNVIYDTMDWLGLHPDVVVRQSDRGNLYKEIAEALVVLNVAGVAENGAIVIENINSIFIPNSWKDSIAGEIKTSQKDRDVLKSLVLIKGDGSPSYNFATAVDDLCMDTNHVIRGHDHISNTVKQIAMMNCIKHIPQYHNCIIPKYTHVGLIFKDRKKLSKRDAAASMFSYKDTGIYPDAALNFMLRLGWAETDGKTIKKIPKDMAIEIFYSKGKMRNQPSNMDQQLLNFYQKQYTPR
jgi:glutamyl-tRNA synthetase